MLSICQLHLQLPFDDCPTVAAADIDSDTLSMSAAATVGQSSCVCVCAITDDYDKESNIYYSFPKYVPGNYCQFINDYSCLYNNTALKIMLIQRWGL